MSTTATETARQAVDLARKLSPTMLDALVRSSGRYLGGTITQPTREALRRRGLVVGGGVLLTDLGRVVRDVLIRGRNAVLVDARNAAVTAELLAALNAAIPPETHAALAEEAERQANR